MRSVTRNPPTTLIMAKITANRPSHRAAGLVPPPATISAPMMVIPEIALDPDINGVCSVGGTLVMTSNPTNIASTKTTRSPTSASSMLGPPSAAS
jgi:hypothetical protein